jgi:hypothetical protein
MGKRRNKFGATFTALAIIALSAFLLVNLWRSPEPEHLDRSAGSWLAGYSNSRLVPASRTIVTVNRAGKTVPVRIVAGGPPALPVNNVSETLSAFDAMGAPGREVLLRAMGHQDAWPMLMYRKGYAGPLKRVQDWLPAPGPTAEELRHNSIEIFSRLRPVPTNLVSALLTVIRDADDRTARLALDRLIGAHPTDGEVAAAIRHLSLIELPRDSAIRIGRAFALPFELVRPLVDPLMIEEDSWLREQALCLLESSECGAGTVVDLATKALRDADSNVRYRAVYLLRGEGTNAATALPELRNRLTDESVIVRNGARRAITAIEGAAGPVP